MQIPLAKRSSELELLRRYLKSAPGHSIYEFILNFYNEFEDWIEPKAEKLIRYFIPRFVDRDDQSSFRVYWNTRRAICHSLLNLIFGTFMLLVLLIFSNWSEFKTWTIPVFIQLVALMLYRQGWTWWLVSLGHLAIWILSTTLGAQSDGLTIFFLKVNCLLDSIVFLFGSKILIPASIFACMWVFSVSRSFDLSSATPPHSNALILARMTNILSWSALHRIISESIHESLQSVLSQFGDYRSVFLSKIGHEMKSALVGIAGSSELILSEIRKDDVDTKYVGELVETSQYCTNHLLELINDILDFSKISAGVVVLNDESFRLREAVRQAAAIVIPLVVRSGVRFEVRIADDCPEYVVGDPLRLRQIIINILTNSVKFTERGEIVLSVFRDSAKPASIKNQIPPMRAEMPLYHFHESSEPLGGEPADQIEHATAKLGDRSFHSGKTGDVLVFCVSDSGIGIQTEFLDKIYEPFTQSHAARGSGGSGLGMNIAMHLTQAMKGSIDVFTTSGVGSRFVVTIPLREGTAPPQETPHTGSPFISSLRKRLIEYGNECRILLADDIVVNQRIITKLLNSVGVPTFAIDCCSNGAEVISMIQKTGIERYLIIFLDIEMPVKNGIQAAEEIRHMEGGATAFLCSLTAHEADSMKELLPQNAHFDYTLSKPVTAAALQSALRRASSRRVAWTMPRQRSSEAVLYSIKKLTTTTTATSSTCLAGQSSGEGKEKQKLS